MLEGPGGNKTLDLGDLVLGLAVLLEGTTDGGTGDRVSLLQLEELPDLGSPLGTQPDGVDNIGQTGELLVTLLDNDDVQDGEISTDDATTNRPPATVTITLGDEAVGVYEEGKEGKDNGGKGGGGEGRLGMNEGVGGTG